MSKLKTYRGDKAKADKLFSEVIRMPGYCEAEGKRWGTCSFKQLQCAHIISRRFNSVRTDTRNAFCLCAGHHRRFTDHPREFSHFITDTWAADFYDAVYAKSQMVIKVNWSERIEFLKQVKQGELTLQEARNMEE
jgi:hypothetical protein